MMTIDQIGMGHDSLDQGRDDLGQFTEKTQSRPDVHLTSNDEGTFLFPPTSFDSVESYAKFWTAVPISDGILANITLGYAEMIRKQSIAVGVRWGHTYDNAHARELHQGSDRSKAEALAARDAAYNAYFEEWHQTRPRRIKADYARSVARTGQLSYYRGSLSSADQDAIHASTISIGGKDLTSGM